MSEVRKKIILNTIVKEYIKTAQPVSSGLLANKYNLGVKAATIRNEMMTLEDEGYIYQPHTSSGRVPSEMAYLNYIKDKQEKWTKLKVTDEEKLKDSLKDLRSAAKVLAELSGSAVFWAFHKNNLYHTGLSNLFSQPEFKTSETVCNVSLVIDRMEDIIDKLFDNLKYELVFKIGENNPFGPFLGTIILKYRLDNKSGMCGLLGPMRMDYDRGAALLNCINNNIK
jgi:transcriptional regulator of heat shock response